jgi:hypothetical protein
MIKRLLLASVSALLVAGCTSVQGPPRILNSHGTLAAPADGNPNAPGNLEANFQAAALAAFPGADRDGNAPPVTAAVIDEFKRSGFALVYARCNDYFWRMGGNQTRARVARDAIAPIVTLLTGIIGLRDFTTNPTREQDLIQALSLGSAFATSGLDIYDSHFLFGAENINSVRILTFNALATHRTGVDTLQVTTPEQAAIHLIDHQAICTPPNILALAREAIATGRLEQTISGGGGGRRDLDWRRSLANELGLEGQLSAEQAFALWWLLENNPAESEMARINELLGDMPADVNPLTAGSDEEAPPVLKPGWSHRAGIARLLASIPPATLAAYGQRLTAEREPDAAGAEAGGALIGRRSLPPLTPLESNSGFQRVGVRVSN